MMSLARKLIQQGHGGVYVGVLKEDGEERMTGKVNIVGKG